MMSSDTPKDITITLPDGSTLSYTIRGLKEGEVESWTAFCASVFSYKPNPPPAAYFARHYFHDPHRDANLIRVACETTSGNIVASCRVFVRTISLTSNNSVKAGGIGEVCTLQEHRRRGLSKLLLQNAIEIMTLQKMELSLLHAAPAFYPVYQSSGYEGTTSQWSTVTIKGLSSNNDDSASTIRMAQFPRDTKTLMKLHQEFTQATFLGSIVRTEDYWNDYLSKELEGSLYVLTNPEGIVLAWLSIRPRGDKYQLREFGCERKALDSSYARQFRDLLSTATRDLTNETFTLQLPTFVLENIRPDKPSFIGWDSQQSEDDLGWMYRPICPSEATKEGMPKLNKKSPHLIWPSDAF